MLMNFGFLLQYGNREFFVRMLGEGFTRVACGCNRQHVNGFRFAAVIAFYGEGDSIATWQVTKEKARGGLGESDYVPPEEIRYSTTAFTEFVTANRIVMGVRMDLLGVIDKWFMSEMTS
mgnify:CR=1 FL=1